MDYIRKPLNCFRSLMTNFLPSQKTSVSSKPIDLPETKLEKCSQAEPSNRHRGELTGPERITVELRIPDADMAKKIMHRTIQLLEETARTTSCEVERQQAEECVRLILRDNPTLQ
uniref:(northern house mosquito) hypothetical protein n=1 Tax=Culex pipiens TaxID=7175 RepID=A0A8D8CRL1_CULPI